MRQLKYCFDLDGTICEVKSTGQSYEDVQPLPGAVETLKRLRDQGHYIIILTARNMATYDNNLGKVIANQAPIVIDWLKRHEVPYDELLFGKPNADFFIDDKAVQFKSWDTLNKTLFYNEGLSN